MNAATVQLNAGGLLLPKTKVDADAAEQIVARTYRHPALGDRPLVRLASDRLGQAEDLAMEFLGFGAPAVSAPLALQQRSSLGFAAWALINDPANARFALDLVKRMKGTARQARSKPGHAWDTYSEMAKELGRSVRHFLPPFWEEAGRAFKDAGNTNYAGRALNKSLEAERVHALESDRARRRDVVLEFVLAGCLAGNALSEYANDLQGQYEADEAFAIFRDLCVRRTRGGMAPWASMPKDFLKLAKAAELDGDAELEKWLEELIEAPAMGRAPYQFWKTCSVLCKRLVSRSPRFAVALLRHTRPEPRYYGESKLHPWLDLLEEWGVLDYLPEDEHKGAPPLGEPIATWLSRVIREQVPAAKRSLELLEKLTARLKKENVPLELSISRGYWSTAIDVDVLETCLSSGIKVNDPLASTTVTFAGWLSAHLDHPRRNQDIVASSADERFRVALKRGLAEALACRGGAKQQGYRQSNLEQRSFPLAAADRPGIKKLWHEHTSDDIAALEGSGLASFEAALKRLTPTLWPDTLRLFPDLAERLMRLDTVAMLQRTLQAGVFDEYGMPALEEAVDKNKVKIQFGHYRNSNVYLTYPSIVFTDKVHAYVIGGDGKFRKQELRLPAKCEILSIVVVGDDLAIQYRDEKYQGHFYWASNPAEVHDASQFGHYTNARHIATLREDGSVFFGQQLVRPGDKQFPGSQPYLYDGERFWRISHEFDRMTAKQIWKIREVDPTTGKQTRESVPGWFEETEGGTLELASSTLLRAPAGTEETPLGSKDGMHGWKTIKRRDGSYIGIGIDGRRWDKPLMNPDGTTAAAVALLRQPATSEYLPVTSGDAHIVTHRLWDTTGSTVIAALHEFSDNYAAGQAAGVPPLPFWHLLKERDPASSQKLRKISREACSSLFQSAAEDRKTRAPAATGSKDKPKSVLQNLIPAVKKLLPGAPERMILGIARIVEDAESDSAEFIALRDKANSEATEGPKLTGVTVDHNSDIAAEHWGMRKFHQHGHDRPVSVSQHLVSAAEFLKGKSPAGDLPPTDYLWFSMLENLPLHCWQTYWRALAAKLSQKVEKKVVWLEFLKLWHELGIAGLSGQLDLMEGYPIGATKNAWGGFNVSLVGGSSFTLQNGADRFIVIGGDSYGFNQLPYFFLRYSTAKTPGNPPGYEVTNVRRVGSNYDSMRVAEFIAAAEAAVEPPLPSKGELETVAKNLSASPAEIGLIWLGGLNMDGYAANFLPAQLRTALGLKTTDATAGKQALRNLKGTLLADLYQAVVSRGCDAPFSADRGPVLQAIEETWKAKMPKRLQLDAALQTRLSAVGKASRWQQVDHEALLAAASDPANHPSLQPQDYEFQVKTQHGHSHLQLGVKNKTEGKLVGDLLRSTVNMVSLIHTETPAGHPARATMPALIKQITKLLDHKGTLLDLGMMYVVTLVNKTPLKPSEWINKQFGKTTVNNKDGSVRFEDELVVAACVDSSHQIFIAFRPAALKDTADLSRLIAIMANYVSAGTATYQGFPQVVAVVKGPGFQKLAGAILAKNVPAGEWPQNPNHTAPAVLESIRKKQKLGEEAAVLYAQLLALPDPTNAKIATWNGWSAAQVKKAAAELVDRKLVLEATRARAGRSVFLPGEWMELKSPWLPIENWKLAHLIECDIDPGIACPAGGPIVLRPFEDLFSAAWKRVLDGDEPRYEEAKRKKKK
jgi:hypothetical protein